MNGIKIRAEISDTNQLKQALEYGRFDYLYVPEKFLNSDISDKEKIIVIPPVFLGDCEKQITVRLKELKALGFKRALAHTAGHIPVIAESGLYVHGGMRLNVTNSKAAGFFAGLGLEDLILSCELTAARIRSVKSCVTTGIVAYGRLPLMITRRCPINDGKPCGNKEGCGKFLTDRRGEKIKALCSNMVELLNPDILTIADKQNDFSAMDFFILRFTDEKDIVSVTGDFQKGIVPKKNFTRGLYYRGVE